MTLSTLRIGCTLAALFVSVSPAAVLAQQPAQNQQETIFERNRYEARSGVEFANGFTSYSETKRTRVVRERRGDESLITYNLLDGAMVSESVDGAMAMPMVAPPEAVIDAAYRYDYETKTLHGPEGFADYFNAHIRAHLPDAERGEPGRWTIPVTLGDLGLAALGDVPVKVSVERSFAEHDGRRYGLISFDIPAFAYTLETGESMVHWARGAAITDEDFGIVYYLVARHRGVAGAGSPDQRPLSVKLYEFATDRDGNPLLPLDSFVEGDALIQEAALGMDSDAGPRLQAMTEAELGLALDRGFFKAATALTPLAFSAAEQGANQTGASSAQAQLESSPQEGILLRTIRKAIYAQNPELKSLFQELPAVQKFAEMTQSNAEAAKQIAQIRARPGMTSEFFLKQLTRGEDAIQLQQRMQQAAAAGDKSEVNRLVNIRKQATQMMIKETQSKRNQIKALESKITSADELFAARKEAQAAVASATKTNPGKFSAFLKGLGIAGSTANTANTGSLLLDTFFGEDQPYDENTQDYLESSGSRLFWQLTDIGVSGATGDGYNLVTSGLGILATSGRDVRLSYYGELDADYQAASARADARLTYYRYLAKRREKVLDELKEARGDLDELKAVFAQMDEIDREEALLNDLTPPPPPPPPPPTREELLSGLAAELDALEPDYPTVSEAQKKALRDRALAAKFAREGGGDIDYDVFGDALAALLAGAFDGDFGDKGDLGNDRLMRDLAIMRDADGRDLLSGLFGGGELGDLFEGSEEFTEADLTRILMEQAGADTKAQRISDQVPSMSISEFADTNAFKYNNMSGIVPTDLSKYQEWLATQDIARLERLARQAGYPNLASALADAENLIRLSQDTGYRQWANTAPGCASIAGCGPNYLGRWAMKRSTVALGDILSQSRDIFSTGGFSDIGISGFNLMYLLRDFGAQDGDLIDVQITQFGRVIANIKGHFLLNEGSPFNVQLKPGVAQMVITALNEGSLPPNTAEVVIENVVRGNAVQTYSLETGQTAVLRIEAGASAGSAPSATASDTLAPPLRLRPTGSVIAAQPVRIDLDAFQRARPDQPQPATRAPGSARPNQR